MIKMVNKKQFITWICRNPKCRNERGKRTSFKLTIKDDKQTVSMWCVKCQSKMKRKLEVSR
ncbi:MAG TPA: hypothetical protein VMZ91_12085 [Candidatus Paceibacterota bacterium]|nr:hypothetical protein [Candidatus Paceibacterota bacterium]